MIWALLGCRPAPPDTVLEVDLRSTGVFVEGERSEDPGTAALLWGDEAAEAGLDIEVHLRAPAEMPVETVMELVRVLDGSGRTHTHMGLSEGATLPLTFGGCHHPPVPERVEELASSASVVLREDGGFQVLVGFAAVGDWDCLVAATLQPPDCPVLFAHDPELAAACAEPGEQPPFRVFLELEDLDQLHALASPRRVALSAEPQVPFGRLFNEAQRLGPVELGAAWPPDLDDVGGTLKTSRELELAAARWAGSTGTESP